MENAITNEMKDTRLIRVAPPEGCKISIPIVNLGEYLTSNSVSLNSYEKRLGLKSSRMELLGVAKKGIKKNKIDKKSRVEENCTMADNNAEDADAAEPGSSVSEKLPTINCNEKSGAEQHAEPNRFPGRETVERIREGWNVDEANTITVGDLFLMFGRESKITLEYWWDWNLQSQRDGQSAATSVRDNNQCLMLQKLLSIAKHSYDTSKVYDNSSGSNETVISTRILSKDSTFRKPLIPQTYHKIGTTDSFKTQIDTFKTRFSKRGRTVRRKSLVVQRVLPIISATSNSLEEVPANSQEIDKANDIPLNNNQQTDKSQSIIINEVSDKDNIFLNELEATRDPKPTNSIITSATQILKEGEHQWLNSEVADFSLSSFLGQLESPLKRNGENIVEDIRPPSDVVSQMQCLMGESSVDYMAKFANLASQIASDDNKK